MLLIILIIILVIILWCDDNYEHFESTNPSFNPNLIAFPFKNFITDTDKVIKIIGISAPFRSDEHRKWYNMCKNYGYEFVGISSYCEFPGRLSNPHEDRYHEKNGDNYESMVKTWLHCFREPEKYIHSDIPKLLWSESDTICPKIVRPSNVQKKYDIIYVCLDDSTDSCVEGWQAYNRNWELAKKCFSRLCQINRNLQILIVGRTKCKIKFCGNTIKNIPFQPSDKFLEYMNKSRIIFIPNIYDASPRVLCQALCLNLRCLVNKDIIGGWKYVNDQTGEFFDNEENFITQCHKILRNYDFYHPRDWYSKNYGPDISGITLLNFFKKNYPNIDFMDAKYLKIRW